jgi:hypothetical protein
MKTEISYRSSYSILLARIHGDDSTNLLLMKRNRLTKLRHRLRGPFANAHCGHYCRHTPYSVRRLDPECLARWISIKSIQPHPFEFQPQAYAQPAFLSHWRSKRSETPPSSHQVLDFPSPCLCTGFYAARYPRVAESSSQRNCVKIMAAILSPRSSRLDMHFNLCYLSQAYHFSAASIHISITRDPFVSSSSSSGEPSLTP